MAETVEPALCFGSTIDRRDRLSDSLEQLRRDVAMLRGMTVMGFSMLGLQLVVLVILRYAGL